MKFKYLCIICISLIAMLFLTSCAGGEITDTTATDESDGVTDMTENTDTGIFAEIVEGEKCEIQITVSDKLDTTESASDTKDKTDIEVQFAYTVREKIKSCVGVNLAVATDLVFPGTDTSASREILIGDTNRAETETFRRTLGYAEYGYGIVGNKIVIYGWTLPLLEQAVDLFCRDINMVKNEKNGQKVIELTQNFGKTSEYDLYLTDIPAYDSKNGGISGAMDAYDDTLLLYVTDTDINEYRDYLKKLENDGWKSKFVNSITGNEFAAYTSDKGLVYVYYIGSENSVRIVTSKRYELPEYTDSMPSFTKVTDTVYTQLKVHTSSGTFGTGNVITLEDGSYIVIDGGLYKDGCELDKNLYNYLKDNNKRTDGKIVIAAWILTHDHSDHFLTFYRFAKNYGSVVKLEKIYCNIAEENYTYNAYNPEHYFRKYYFEISNYFGGVGYVKLHTGMKFYIRNMKFEVLFTQEDIYPKRCHWFNDVSVVLKATAAGQSVMLLADAGPDTSDVMEIRYTSDFLKSDICQVAHHGYRGVSIKLYRMIDAHTLFWTGSEANYKDLTTKTSREFYSVNKYLADTYGNGNVIIAEKSYEITLPFAKGGNVREIIY